MGAGLGTLAAMSAALAIPELPRAAYIGVEGSMGCRQGVCGGRGDTWHAETCTMLCVPGAPALLWSCRVLSSDKPLHLLCCISTRGCLTTPAYSPPHSCLLATKHQIHLCMIALQSSFPCVCPVQPSVCLSRSFTVYLPAPQAVTTAAASPPLSGGAAHRRSPPSATPVGCTTARPARCLNARPLPPHRQTLLQLLPATWETHKSSQTQASSRSSSSRRMAWSQWTPAARHRRRSRL